MTPTGAGRHCASCEKVVVDFTWMTDGELAAWFGARAGQSVCGKYRPDQLARPIQPVAAIAGRRPAWLLSLSVVVAACSTKTVDDQSVPPGPHNDAQLLPPTTVHGRVYHPATGKPVQALIGIEGDTIHTFSDSVGRFTLEVPTRRADQHLLALAALTPLCSTSAVAADGVEIALPCASDDAYEPVLGQTHVDTIAARGHSWSVSKHTLRRWLSPPPPPPERIISTGQFVPPTD